MHRNIESLERKSTLEAIKILKKKEFLMWHSGLLIQHCLCLPSGAGSIPGPMQQVKDLALPWLQHRWQLRLGFNPWPGNFHISQVQPKKRKKKNKKKPLNVTKKSVMIYQSFFFFFLNLFRATAEAHGSLQTRGGMGAIAAT